MPILQPLKLLFIIVCILFAKLVTAQNIDFENIGRGKPFKVSGSVAANTIYYKSNQNRARAPFTYFLQGTLNFNVYEFSIPVSYSYSNQGENLQYQLPFNFNRLSLHPKYKWVQAHIGDVSMDFSPYTLAGHQFTGGGIELTPKGGITFSAMYGRLLKAVEDDDKPQTEPSFKRMGYGLKVEHVLSFEFTNFCPDSFTIQNLILEKPRGCHPELDSGSILPKFL